MHRFMKPYQEVQLKGLPKDLELKTKFVAKKKSERMTDWGRNDLCLYGSRIKRKNSGEIEVKTQKARFFDQENANKRTLGTKQLTREQQINKNKQLLSEMKAQREQLNKKFDKITQRHMKNQQIISQRQKNPQVQQKQSNNADQLNDDMLFGSFMADIPKNFNVKSFQTMGAPKFQSDQAFFQHQQQLFDPLKQYPPDTYVLFSILVHTGGAYGGHYFAYIFDGSDWFCFNDNNVRKVNRTQIRKYGNPSQHTSFGANAYLLFYRQANTFKKKMFEEIQIPEELSDKVKKERVIEEQKEESKTQAMQGRCLSIGNKVLFKVYWPNRKTDEQNNIVEDDNRYQVIVMDDKMSDTIGSLRQKVREVMQVMLEDENWRIRRYNKLEDQFYEIYGPETYELSLDTLGFRQTCYIGIQAKKKGQEFQGYDQKNITIKLNVWRENLTILTQKYLKPEKISIRDEITFQQFYQKVERVLQMKDPVILKRNFSSGNPYNIFRLHEHQDKTLISLRFFNGINLYVEPRTQGHLLWDKQFKDQKYRCLIKFNDPNLSLQKNQQLYFDTRKTLGDLKTALSAKISIPFQEFRIKKSQQTMSEMITYKKKLSELRFINNQFLYLEKGSSSKGSIILKRGFIGINDDQISYDLGEQSQVQLNSTIGTVADIKNMLAKQLNIKTFNIRIREYKAFQFGQIYRDFQPVQRLKQKSLVWQQIQEQDPHGKQIYIRIFSLVSMEMGPLLSIFIENDANYQQFACILQQQTQIKKDKILVWRAPSSYIQKSMLLDIEWNEIAFIPKAIREEPLYINNDGSILIVKEAETAYHAKPQKKIVSCQEPVIGNKRKAQQSLKITVVEEKEIFEVENEQQPKKIDNYQGGQQLDKNDDDLFQHKKSLQGP